MYEKHEVVRQWEQDPEYQALPSEVKRQTLTSLFDTDLADDEFRSLDPQTQEQTRSNFVEANLAPEPKTSLLSYQAQPKPVAEELPSRGAVGDIFAASIAGVKDLGEMVARAARTADRPGGIDIVRNAATGVIDASTAAEENYDIFKPSRESQEGATRGALYGGFRAAPASVGPALVGAAAGSVLGPAGAVAGGAGLAAGMFGLAEYDSFIEEAKKQGIPEEAVQSNAVKSAFLEGGLEAAATALDLVLFRAGRPLTSQIKQTVKALLKPGALKTVKEAGKGVLKAAPGELSTEMAQGYGEAALRKQSGMETVEPLEAAKQAIGPTMVMTALFGLSASGMNAWQRKTTERALVNIEADPKRRARAVDTVSAEIDRQYGPEAAKQWRQQALTAVQQGAEIPLDKELQPIKKKTSFDQWRDQRQGILTNLQTQVQTGKLSADDLLDVRRDPRIADLGLDDDLNKLIIEAKGAKLGAPVVTPEVEDVPMFTESTGEVAGVVPPESTVESVVKPEEIPVQENEPIQENPEATTELSKEDRIKLLDKLGAATETRFGIVKDLSDEDLMRVASEGAKPVEAPTEEKPAETDFEKWDKQRAATIRESKAAGNQHLDDSILAVETLRGKEVYNVHDPKEHGKVLTVSNRGDVVVLWADQYSADKNNIGRQESKDKKGKVIGYESWLGPNDHRDYVVGKPSTKTPTPSPKAVEREAWETTRERAVWGEFIPDGLSTDRALAARLARWEKIKHEAKGVNIESVEQAIAKEKARIERANNHRTSVQQALSEGKPVPLEVLKDYPDLAPKATLPSVPNEPELRSKVEEQLKSGDKGILDTIKESIKTNGVAATEDLVRNAEGDLVGKTRKGIERKSLQNKLKKIEPEINAHLEAEKNGVTFNGMQEVPHKEPIPLFTDPETGSTFATTGGETVAEGLARTRKAFEEGKPTTPAVEPTIPERGKQQETAPKRTKKQQVSAERLERALSIIEEHAPKEMKRENKLRRKAIDNAWSTIRTHAGNLGIEVPKRGTYYNPESDLKAAQEIRKQLQPQEAKPAPVVEETGEGKKAPPLPTEKGKIEDFGEKIGGARKDTAERGYAMTGTKKETGEESSWKKKYIAMEKVREPGKWVIANKKAVEAGTFTRGSEQTFPSQEEAEKAIPLYAVAESHRVYQTKTGGKYEIFKKVGDRKLFKVVNQEFDSREDAMKHMVQHAEDILNIKTTFGEEILPVPETVYRKGEERRDKPATPEMFMETFAPRGIEFGNWNNQEERQQVMNHAYDGLLDLAETLNVSPKALMLNGELAIAFGARGQGLTGARAHYERDYGVINLTKMKGAGALAHEWFHALDHYLGRLDTKASAEKVTNERGDLVYKAGSARSDYLSQGASYKSQLRQELKDAYKKLIDTMYKKAEQYVEDTKKADEFLGRARENLKEKLGEVRKDLERDMTNYHKSKGGYSSKPIKYFEPASAEQLAELDRLSTILIEGGDLEVKHKPNEKVQGGWGGRMTNNTLEAMNVILKEVRNHQGFNKEQTGWLDKVRAAMTTYRDRLKMLEDAQAGTEKTKKVPTSYAIEAKKMDQARTGDYWSEPHEMAARAFSSYVEDKISEKGGQSDFLVYHAHGGILLPMIDGFIARPYPEGKEREATNQAFDDFVSTLQTKETEKGVAFFSRTTQTKGVKTSDLTNSIGKFLSLLPNAPIAEFHDTFASLPEDIREKSALPSGWSIRKVSKDSFNLLDEKGAVKGIHPTKEDAIAAAEQHNQKIYSKRGRFVEGVYSQGKIHFVADSIPSIQRAFSVMWHELSHYGCRKLFGAQYENFLSRVYLSYGPSKLKPIATLYGLDFSQKKDRLKAADEKIAQIIQTGENPGLIKKLIALIKNWLRKPLEAIGINLKISDNDILSLVGPKVRDYLMSAHPETLSVLREDLDPMFQISAWHGSPHKFDRFSTEFIGAGEGAQARGWGLYFSSEEEVGTFYANMMKGDYFFLNGKPVNDQWIQTGINALKEDAVPITIQNLKERMRAIKKESLGLGKVDEAIKIENSMKNLYVPEAEIRHFNHNLYKTTLHKGKEPGEYDYLDWNSQIPDAQMQKITKQMAQEPKEVQAQWAEWVKGKEHPYSAYEMIAGSEVPFRSFATEKQAQDFIDYRKEKTPSRTFYLRTPNKSGGTVYNKLSDILGSEKDASLFLLRAGIDGNKFPSGSIGGTETGGTNYVVFDENAVDIDERISFSRREDTDTAYLDAVERGDMETAQRMVDEAAKKAGYLSEKVYHGTNATFTIFDDFRAARKTYQRETGESLYWFTPNKNRAMEYGDKIISAYLIYKNPMIVRAVSDELAPGDATGAIEDAIANEHDAVVFQYEYKKKPRFIFQEPENVRDWGYVVFSPSQIKSAEPVTFDKGKVIPLSERFHPENDDIRFSRREEEPEAPYVSSWLDNTLKALEEKKAEPKDKSESTRNIRKLENHPTDETLAGKVFSEAEINIDDYMKNGVFDAEKYEKETGIKIGEPGKNSFPKDLYAGLRWIQTAQDHAKNYPAMRDLLNVEVEENGAASQMSIADRHTTEDFFTLSKEELPSVRDALILGDNEERIVPNEELEQKFHLSEKQKKGYWAARKVLEQKLKLICGHFLEGVLGERYSDKILDAMWTRNHALMKKGADKKAINQRFMEKLEGLTLDLTKEDSERIEFIADWSFDRRGYVPHTWKSPWRVWVKTVEGDIHLLDIPRAPWMLKPTREARENSAEEAARKLLIETFGTASNGNPLVQAGWKVIRHAEIPVELTEDAKLGTMKSIIDAASDRVMAQYKNTLSPAEQEKLSGLQEAIQQNMTEMVLAKGWGRHLIGRKGVKGFRTDLENVLPEYLYGFNKFLSKGRKSRRFAEVMKTVDPTKTPNLWLHAKEYVSDMLGQSSEAGYFKNIAGLYFLAADLSAGALNLTQNWTHAVNLMRKIPGPEATEKQLGKAMKDIQAEYFAAKKAGREMFTQANEHVGKEDLEALRTAYERGYLDPAHFGEVTGLIENKVHQHYISEAYRFIFKLFTGSEGWNRMSSYLAAHRRAREAKLDDPDTAALDVMNGAHFLYGRGNRPLWVRRTGAIGNAAYTFMTYPVSNITFLKHRIEDALSAKRKADPEEFRTAMRVLGGHLAYTFALGGLQAMPFYFLAKLIWGLFSEPEDDPEMVTRRVLHDRTLGRIVNRGIPSVFGNDMSWRVEGTDILDIPIGFQTAQTIKRRLEKGYELFSEGDVWGGIFMALPDMFMNPYKAIAGYREGGTREGVPPIQYTTGEALWKAGGFTPTRESETYKAVEITKKKRAQRLERLEIYAERYLKYKRNNDLRGLWKLKDEIRQQYEEEKAKGVEGVPIKWKDVRTSARLRMISRNKGYVERVPKYMQKYQKEVSKQLGIGE